MKRKNDTLSQTIVGLFMVVLMALLAYFTIVVSGVDVFMARNRQSVRISFTQVGGLKEHDNVMFRGTKVGAVERVLVTPTNLLVVAEIDEGVLLRRGYRVQVCSLSMLGGSYLLLEEGAGDVIDVAHEVLSGETPSDWMQDVATIARNLNELTSRAELRSIVTNVEAVSVKANRFMDRVNDFMGTANSIATNTDLIVSRVQRGEGFVGRIFSKEETLYRNLEATLANARAVTDRLNSDRLLGDLESGVAAFRKAAESLDARATVEKANRLLDNLNAVACGLKEGKGTLGRLAQDPRLYEELDGLIRDVRQVIDNFRDTTPITTFSSLAVGAF